MATAMEHLAHNYVEAIIERDLVRVSGGMRDCVPRVWVLLRTQYAFEPKASRCARFLQPAIRSLLLVELLVFKRAHM